VIGTDERSLRLAVAGGHIYRTNWPTGAKQWAGTIGRANLDGTGVNQRFISTASGPCGVAVYKGHIYWGLTGASPTAR
jgi:virginiamycin B lyase